ncbi:MAG: cobalt ECF transporter T component CbiQ [Chloroflexi bacterium]|nr:cobalt ECF transporter T component CbiQ [Chloroflexota bacterium]
MTTAAGFLDRYLEGESWFHRTDARIKLVMALGFIFATTSIPPGKWTGFAAMLILVWFAAGVSRVGLPRVFLRSLVAIPFILIALPTVFTKPGAPLFELDLALFALTGTREGLDFFFSVLLKSWASVTAAVVLTATTPPLKLLEALRALRIPAVLVAIVMLMYRYLFVLVEEAQSMMRARAARSAAIGPKAGGSIVWRAKSAGGMAGSLFIRTLDRSERIYMAMVARGYDGTIRQADAIPLRRGAMVTLALLLCLFASVAVAARMVL